MFVMFLFGFAMVPLYNVLCTRLGINGKTNLNATRPGGQIDPTRYIRVEFTTDVNQRLNISFYPRVNHVFLHPGENILIYFFVKNHYNSAMIIQAIPSVTPGIAANYLKKTECFCFQEQHLAPKQGIDLPVLFHLDPDLPKTIHTITLAYTMFDRAKIKYPFKPKTISRLS